MGECVGVVTVGNGHCGADEWAIAGSQGMVGVARVDGGGGRGLWVVYGRGRWDTG